MDHKGITAGELATLLEVQRSNISHVLNGRNMPGAAFIEKLLLSFPEMDARWLLTGQGEMLVKSGDVDEGDTPLRNETPQSAVKLSSEISTKQSDSKLVDKVVLLLSDGTFIDYTKK